MNSLANIEFLTTISNIEAVYTAMATSDAQSTEEAVKAAAAASSGSSAGDAEASVNQVIEAADGNAETAISDDDAALEGDAGAEIDGETAETGTADEGMAADNTVMDESAGMETGMGEVPDSEGMNIDPSMMDGNNFDTGMMVDPAAAAAKGSLLSSWPFVIGISAAVLVVSIALGALLARMKIKKGIELYED